MEEMTEEQKKMAGQLNQFFAEMMLNMKRLEDKQNGLKAMIEELIPQFFILHAMIEPKLTEEEKTAAIKEGGELTGKLMAMQAAIKKEKENEPLETITMGEIFHNYWKPPEI